MAQGKWLGIMIAVVVWNIGTAFTQAPPSALRVERLLERPIITPRLHPSIGTNIQGPSLIPHIASPDAHVDLAGRQILMYFHGLEGLGRQVTRVATSPDGIRFRVRPEVLGRTYMRTFKHHGYTYAMAMPGQFYRSRDGLGGFEEGPRLFNANMRHAALLKRGDTLYVFWTQVGHTPERILVSTIELASDWMKWSESAPVEVLRPERDWEGADAPLERSLRSTAYGHVNQLRDPAIFEENGRTFILYAVAGESGIAIAEVRLDK